VVVVAACSSPSSNHDAPLTLEGGTLIDVTEGEIARATPSEPILIFSGPSWASIDPYTGELVLAPDCTVAPGIDGPPKHYSFEIVPALSYGMSLDVDVAVHPSAARGCMPSLIGNVANAPACPATWPVNLPSVYGLGNSIVPLNFTGPDSWDRVLYLDVNDPGSADDPQLVSRIATDAPLEFTVYGNPNQRCAPIPNSGITGIFELDYSFAQDATSPIAASGSWTLDWQENDSFGIEVHSCASSSGACVRDEPNKVGAPYHWCIGMDAGATVTLVVNVWANKQTSWVPPIDATLAAQLSSASIVGLIGPDQAVTGSLPVHFGQASMPTPIPVTVDLSHAQPGDQLTLQLTSPLIDPNTVTTQIDLLTAPSTCP
jgi:hypothetical protein